MAPRDSSDVSGDKCVGSEAVRQKYNLKSVDKAIKIPLIKDAVQLTKTKVSPLVEEVARPILDNLCGSVEEIKNSATVGNLDEIASEGINLVKEAAPILSQPSQEAIEASKEVAMTYVNIFKEYVASFSVAQVALKLGESGLSAVDTLLNLTGLETAVPQASAVVNNVRRSARAVRRAGSRRRGACKPAKSIGEVSLVGAVLEVLGVNSVLAFVGLVLAPIIRQAEPIYKSPRKQKPESEEKESESSSESECEDDALTVRQRLSPEKLAEYDSDADSDYAPSEASEDSLEYDSDPEKDAEGGSEVVYEDEHAKVLQSEDNEDEDPIVVDTAADYVEEEIEVIDVDERVGVADVSECNTPQCEKYSHKDLQK